LHADPQLRHAGFFVEVEHPVLGRAPLEGHGFALSECAADWRPAPLWGEHTEAVFGEWLGLGRDEVARLREARVLW
jgi:crotonobetainyl-CoA:carnitine CoA-transferase CaiB-like acyl-CoA transferase